MFEKAVKIAKSAMFPIFRWEQISSTEARVSIAGTGFFINSKGYFISAAHVFDNTVESTSFLYIGRLPEEVHKPRLKIREIVRNNDYDIFVGKIEVNSEKYFNLEKKIPNIGRSVCVSGYPLAKIKPNDQGGLELGGVRRYFQPSFVLDRAKVNCINREFTRIHDGFLVRDVGLFGMSGGPVFDVKGKVIGIQGSVTPPRESKNAAGRSISVENAIVIRSSLVLDLLRANKIRSNFFGRFY
ncbi:MAG: hypothetical protein CEE43_16995 [Promethearchaeota archaeon Loki_b32]|nr:MAG: hypothetical protein CEE43_16995 [Candidatus Lokiarchaeota archaeon Loki_b32]